MLVEQDRMNDAKVEFSSLVQQYPEDDELRYSLALVCLEAKAWDEAKGYLEDLIAGKPCGLGAPEPRPYR